MPETTIRQTDAFIVRESATLNILIGLFFLFLFTITLVNFLNKSHIRNEYASRKLQYILIGTFVPAIGFIIKGFMHKTIITVNKDGFYYMGTLKTNWNNFIGAEVKEIPVTGSYQDNFVLFIRFYKENENGYFETRIPMRNTLDKSGEEVIEAIKKFHEAEIPIT